MPCTSLTWSAEPDDVFGVLLDPFTYPSWVVGAQRVRSVDPAWPAAGSKFHHSVGAPAATVDDSSTLLACEPPHHLRLEVRVRPFGVGVVDFRVNEAEAGRVTVTMCETLSRGPTQPWLRPAVDAAIYLRNAATLRRLRHVVRRASLSPAPAA